MEPTNGRPAARPSAMRRYGPLIGILVVIALVVAGVFVFGGDDGDEAGDTTPVDTSDGPVVLDDDNRDEIDWGPTCDVERGRVAMPYTYAAPCVEPFEGDNGGETYPGVTGDRIKVVWYQGDPSLNPLQAALVRSSGADVDLATGRETAQGYFEIFEQFYELYGREIDLEFYTGTGGPQDEAAARADAIAIAEKQPFAVIDGPGQTPVFAQELVARKILCLGSCALATPENILEDARPYMWGVGPTPNQASLLTAEMVVNLLAGKKAEFAGDPELREQERVFGAMHYDTAAGTQQPAFDALKDALEEGDVELAADIPFLLDVARGQENARTQIAKLKDAGVTSVIFYGDPLTPSFVTKEATAQDYFPEWIIGPNVFVDTVVFGRTYDQQQWKNAFGIGLTTARAQPTAQQPYRLYEWAYGTEPPNNTYAVILGQLTIFFQGVHLAGPNLTPETFQAGLFRYPVTGGNPLQATVSRGEHDIWPNLDLGGADDATLIWWNPEPSGDDEIGNAGQGLYEYAEGGKRYRYGEWPDSGYAGLFDPETSITIYDEVPPDARVPDYPPPPSRAGG